MNGKPTIGKCEVCGRYGELRYSDYPRGDSTRCSEECNRAYNKSLEDAYAARRKFCILCGAEATSDQMAGYQMDANGNPLCWACFDKANPQPTPAAASGSSSGGARKGAVGSAAAAVATWSRTRQITLVLCIFLGIFGVHRFYVGKPKLAVLYIFTAGLAGWGWLVDLIMIILGKFKDKNGNPL